MRRLAERHIKDLQRPSTPPSPVFVRTVIYGLFSLTLYYLLYRYHDFILAYSKEGQWHFIVPISIAFVFSVVHGNFTGQFWDLFGIKAKTTKK